MLLKDVTPLTPASLERALTEIAEAHSESGCAVALSTAAELVQSAVLSSQDPESFVAALDSCPTHFSAELAEVLDRAVNFHKQADGMLGLWMVPVVLLTDGTLPAIINLDMKSSSAMKVSGSLLNQLKLAAQPGTETAGGWTYLLPMLYANESISQAELTALINLPVHARQFIRGDRKSVSFPVEEVAPASVAKLYYLPVVAFTPSDIPVRPPVASEQMMQRVTAWIRQTLNAPQDALEIRVAGQPHPFSVALNVGRRLRNDVLFRHIMAQMVDATGVEPNGMAALIAPYAPHAAQGELTLGVSLVSRLSGAVLGMVTLPVETKDGSEETVLATHVLREMGMDCTQHHTTPIPTVSCQHCGRFQFSMPPAHLLSKGQCQSSANVH